MLVYLVRHGIAADLAPDGALTDADRPLTDLGIERFRKASETYARLMVRPDRIISSPLVRARQTAEILVDVLDWDGELEFSEDLVYSATPTRAATMLQGELLNDADSVALVGHEPHLGSLLGLLLNGVDRAPVPLSKGMCASVELKEPQSMVGKLRFALSQKIARKMV